MRKFLLILGLSLGICVVDLLAGSISQNCVLPSYNPAPKLEEAKVVGVVDGDTIWVRFADGEKEQVRYIGVDTPELSTAECYSGQAIRKNMTLVEGKEVWLERDVKNRDDTGKHRLLRYVYLDSKGSSMVNNLLLETGYGILKTIPPAYKYRKMFKESAQEAWEQRKGLWSKCAVSESITASQAKNNFTQYGGKIVTVGYQVFKIGTARGMAFLNSSDNIYRDFTAVIYSDDLVSDFPGSGIDLSSLEGKEIKVMSKLEWYENGDHSQPQIIIEDPWQLKILT